jgi:hypothetical protein
MYNTLEWHSCLELYEMLIINFYFQGYWFQSGASAYTTQIIIKTDRAMMKKSVSLRWNLTMKNCYSFGKYANISTFLNTNCFFWGFFKHLLSSEYVL